MTNADVAVVGAGPAGLAAAVAAAEAGASVVVLDENDDVGGQIYRQPPATFKKVQGAAAAQAADYRRGATLMARARALPIRFVHAATVWGVFDATRVAYVDPDGAHELVARRLILATGAYDRPLPFPGWTLPGVVTAGGLQNLLKSQGVLPGARVVVAGTGPLILVVARQLIAAGAQVAAVAESTRYLDHVASLPALAWAPGLMLDGARFVAGLARARVPYLTGHAVVRASGQGAVGAVDLAPLGRDGRPALDRARTFGADLLCVGYGFVSSVELVGMAGARLRYDELLDAWVPERDRWMRTSLPSVFAAGDGAGVAGSVVAEFEGRVAGRTAAIDLGFGDEDAETRDARAHLVRWARFRAGIDRMYRFPAGLLDDLDDGTLVCRCEEVDAETIREALEAGADHVNEVKGWTRCGMGRCQGRLCGPTLAHLVARYTGRSLADVGPYTPRPPAKPVPIDALIEGVDVE